ncbi:MAG: tetratricopeptide repeat protein [Chloroflexota bacterium]|jgi:tetratricopeptide (TPR) repeat protein
MPSAQFISSVAANLAYWCDHEGLADPRAWPALDRERRNLFQAVEYGLQLPQTWSAAADLALKSYTYVFERGYWSEWTPVLEQALSACPDENSAVKWRLAQQLGSFYRRLRRLDDAEAFHEQAEAVARSLGDPLLVARAQLGLGRVHFRRRHYDQAERYARLALAGFEALGTCLNLVANTCNLLGNIAVGRGDYDESTEHFYRARDLFRQAQVPIELGRTNVNLYEALGRLGRTQEALALFEEAATIFSTYDLYLERSRLYVNLGFLHYSQDDLAQAEAAFREAYTPAIRRAGPIYLRSLIEMNLGNLLLLKGAFEESRTYFLSAVAGFRQTNARAMLANSLDGLAEIAMVTGKNEEALALYEEALAIVTAIPEDAFANRMEKRFRGLLEELQTKSSGGH